MGKRKMIITVLLLAAGACRPAMPIAPDFLAVFRQDAAVELAPGLVWREKRFVEWWRYKRVLLEAPVISISAKSGHQYIRPDDLKVLADVLRSESEQAVRAELKLAQEAAPDVLRLRIAVTGVVPPTREVSRASVTAGFMPIGIAGMVIEAELSDALSDEPLGALADRRIGSEVRAEFYKGFVSLQYLQRAFAAWGEELRIVLNDKLKHKLWREPEAEAKSAPAPEIVPQEPQTAAEDPPPAEVQPDSVMPLPAPLETRLTQP